MLKFKINKWDFIDALLLLTIYLELVIFEFFGYGPVMNRLLALAIVIRLLLKPAKEMLGLKQWCIMIVLFALFLMGVLFSNTINLETAYRNFMMLLYPILFILYLFYLCRNRNLLIERILNKGFWVFNITMLINIVVLICQITVPYSITAVITANEISYYEDTISGLFAYASTHVICLFTIFILIYDLSVLRKTDNIIKKILFSAYLVMVVTMSVFIAMNNDNKAFFLLLPLSIIIYIMMGNSQLKNNKMQRAIILICSVPITISVLYFLIEPIRNFIDKNMLDIISIMFRVASLGNGVVGSGERIAILAYALSLSSTWALGDGFGSAYVYQSGYHGFNHFGQADMGSFLILGGIGFTVVLFVYYSRSFYKIVVGRKGKMEWPLIAGIVVMLLSLSIYTQCFTRTNTMTCVALIMLAFRYRFYSRMKQEGKEYRGTEKKMKKNTTE